MRRPFWAETRASRRRDPPAMRKPEWSVLWVSPVPGCGARLWARMLGAASDAPAPTPKAQKVNAAST